jgi:hypothetical protein
MSQCDELRSMISAGQLVPAAQELQEHLLPGILAKYLQQTFGDSAVRPTDVHFTVAQMDVRAILTSNYDSLIEGAIAHLNGGRLPLCLTQEDLLARPCPLRTGDFFVFKIHGDYQRPASVVLGSRDYDTLLFRSPSYRHFLERIFSGYTVLFIGFGATDPDLDAALAKLNAIYGRGADPHYILMPQGRLSTIEQRRLLADRRLWVIEYPADSDHSALPAVLAHLAEKCPVRSER